MNTFRETVRIFGLKRFVKVAYRMFTEPGARELEFYSPQGDYSLADATDAALRVLGLPEDWIYSEADLRRADVGNEVLTYHAVNHLVVVYRWPEELARIRDEKAKRPGARP